jgi:hypothetical protein
LEFGTWKLEVGKLGSELIAVTQTMYFKIFDFDVHLGIDLMQCFLIFCGVDYGQAFANVECGSLLLVLNCVPYCSH